MVAVGLRWWLRPVRPTFLSLGRKPMTGLSRYVRGAGAPEVYSSVFGLVVICGTTFRCLVFGLPATSLGTPEAGVVPSPELAMDVGVVVEWWHPHLFPMMGVAVGLAADSLEVLSLA